MKKYMAHVTILPKDGVLDTQGKAVEKTLGGAGYAGISDVRVGKFIRMIVEADDESTAGGTVRAAASDVLANDLVESFTFTMEEIK